MSERKVLSHYYPPDFDPNAIKRSRAPKQTGPRVQTVRLMAPFSMQCTKCGEFIYRGRKFNARKETPPDERYLGIQIYRFYIRCTRCSGEITFRTDPRNLDYACERGAKRNTDPWRRGLGDDTREETVEERLDRLEREQAEEEGREQEARNAMVELEAKTADAKREMAVADALDEIRTRNARIAAAGREGREVDVARPEDDERERQEREDQEAARKAFAFARMQAALDEEPLDEEDGSLAGEEETDGAVSMVTAHSSSSDSAAASVATTASSTEMPPPPLPAPSFKRQVKKKKDHAALLGIKKKTALV